MQLNIEIDVDDTGQMFLWIGETNKTSLKFPVESKEEAAKKIAEYITQEK